MTYAAMAVSGKISFVFGRSSTASVKEHNNTVSEPIRQGEGRTSEMQLVFTILSSPLTY